MTHVSRYRLLGSLAALLLLACVPAQASQAASSRVHRTTSAVTLAAREAAPFAVTFAVHFALTSCPPTAPARALCATGRGHGLTTQLSTASEAVSGTVVLSSPDAVTGCAPEYATVRLGAAGGQLVLHLVGYYCPTSAATSTEVGYYLVTGGTGPFSGASGHGTYEFTGRFEGKTGGTALHLYRGTVTL